MKFLLRVFVLTCSATPAAAQKVPVVDLQPTRQFAEPFSRIRGVRELSDGSVLIADQIEVAVYRIRFETGERVRIGREGAGPQEYDSPTGLYPLPGDSTLLMDLRNGRLAVLSPDGGFGESYSMGEGFSRIFAQSDTVGNLFWREADLSILRMDRATGRIDTVTTLRPPDMFMNNGRSRIVAFSVSDWWAVSWDGRVAVARHDPYRIDWYGLDGSETRGPAVVYDPFPVRRQERRAWEERPRTTMSLGGSSSTGGRAAPPKDRFPDHLPPFERREVHTTPEGGVWVQRIQPAGVTRPLFDVFDATGTRVRQVRLPEGRDVVGFGRGTLYATREDDDGLLWLELYRRR